MDRAAQGPLAGLTRAAVLYNPKTLPMYESFVRELKASRPSAGAEVALLPEAEAPTSNGLVGSSPLYSRALMSTKAVAALNVTEIFEKLTRERAG